VLPFPGVPRLAWPVGPSAEDYATLLTLAGPDEVVWCGAPSEAAAEIAADLGIGFASLGPEAQLDLPC
jgi:hypothetical protein